MKVSGIGFAITTLILSTNCRAYFLHMGCAIEDQCQIQTFGDTLDFLLLFPPERYFFVSVIQKGGPSCFLRQQQHDVTKGTQKWLPMRLRLQDHLELQFENGTTWLSDFQPLEEIPLKSVLISGGFTAPNCPQQTPFFTLRKDSASLTRSIGKHQHLTFSLLATMETLVYLTLGQEKLVLCRNNVTGQLVLGPPKISDEKCQLLTPLETLWLHVAYEDGLVTISSPSEGDKVLRSLYGGSESIDFAFKNERITGEVYVVEHVQGPQQVPIDQEKPKKSGNKWLWVSASGVLVLFLLLLVSASIAFIYYSRWQKAREVLLLLRRLQEESAKEKDTTGAYEGNVYSPPCPPPLCPLPAPRPQDGQYLTPKEIRSLANPEHLYEELTTVLEWQKKAKGKENEAFEQNAKRGDECAKPKG